MLSADINEKCTICSKINSRKVMICNDTNEIIQKFFDSLLHKYQTGLERSMKGRSMKGIFDYVSGMYYVCQKITINCGGSYIDSPKLVSNKNQ